MNAGSHHVDVAIRQGSIRLGQFLKLADAVDQGSDVKELLASEAVTVNGAVEVRRGRQLRRNDVVVVASTTYTVVETAGHRAAASTDQTGRCPPR